MMDLDEAAKAFRELVAIIKALRTPGTGCPWDLEQNHRTLRSYLIEESYEVLDAIDRGDDRAFQGELGDLLLQIVLHAQVADDRGAFSITDVIRGISAKMVRRHPHVFGSVQVSNSDEVRRNWEQIKAAEARGEGGETSPAAALARVPESLPALLRAQRLGEKADRIPFEDAPVSGALERVRQDLAELEGKVGTAAPDSQRAGLEHEFGELFFSLCQLARRLGISAEDSLRACNRRFVDCFRRMEEQTPRPLHDLSGVELEAAWQKAREAAGMDTEGLTRQSE
jgi:tetrapyrrole methylase family protein/MazG family protein